MNSNADFTAIDEAVIFEPGGGQTPTISSLRSAVLQSPSATNHDAEKHESGQSGANVPPQPTVDVAPGSPPCSLDAQTDGRQPDATQTSAFSSDASRRQGDVKQTSIQKPGSSGRQPVVWQTPTTTSLSQESPQAVQLRSRRAGRTEPDDDGRYRHTVRLDRRIEDQRHIIMDELGIDMNAAISVCITTLYRQLKRSRNRGE